MTSEELDLAEFFRRYRVMAVRFAAGLVRGEEAAEDLFQEAARALWERFTSGVVQFESQTHARNYLFRSIHNLAVSQLRSPGSRAVGPPALEAVSEAPNPREILEQAEEEGEERRRGERVDEAIAGLPEREREALRLRYAQALTYREISKRTGTSISTLQARVEAALGKIRGRLGKTDTRP